MNMSEAARHMSTLETENAQLRTQLEEERRQREAAESKLESLGRDLGNSNRQRSEISVLYEQAKQKAKEEFRDAFVKIEEERQKVSKLHDRYCAKGRGISGPCHCSACTIVYGPEGRPNL